LARVYAEGEHPSRTLVFVAFSGEEAGRLGSRYYVEHPLPTGLDDVRAMVNLDTVGRLGQGEVSVVATGTADEWQHIFRGVGFVTGIASRNIAESLESSDQVSFIEHRIPAVQIFTGAHADYHRPGDTADKVDLSGLVKVATFVKEAVDYLVEREEPLSVSIAGGERPSARPSAQAPSSGRKVSFGTVPEFGYPGPGVQVASLVLDSPPEHAGIQPGDVVIRIDDVELADLRGFSDLLKKLEPGQTVVATVLRHGKELALQVTLAPR